MYLRKRRRVLAWVFGLSLVSTSAFSQKTMLTGFVDATAGEHVFYLDANSNLNQLYFIAGIAWASQNLTGTFGGSQPMANSPLTSFVDAAGGQHVFYVDSGHNLNQMYWPGSGATWFPQNISGVFGGAPVGTTSLASFYDPFDNSQHVFYVTYEVAPSQPIAGAPPATGAVNQFYFPGNGAQWFYQDLSDTYSGAAALYDSQLTGYLDATGGEHIVYQDASGNINQLYYPGSGAIWFPQNLTVSYGGNTPATPSGLTSYIDPSGGQHVAYVDTNSNINQLAYIGGASWLSQDLTLSQGGNTAGSGTNLTSYIDATGAQHIAYLDGSQNVNQLYYLSGLKWSPQNLTATYGGNTAGTASTLVAFPNTQADAILSGIGEHIAFLDANDDVNQLYYPGSGTTWFWQNLTAYGGTIPAIEPGSSLSISAGSSN